MLVTILPHAQGNPEIAVAGRSVRISDELACQDSARELNFNVGD
jgi:hypothetical protein